MAITPSRESNVLQVSYIAQDPDLAAKLANGFVKAYLAVSLELRIDPARRYATYFDGQLKIARQELEAAQAKLSEFQRGNGIAVTDERVDVENARLNELSSQLVALQGVSAESASRQAQANSASADRMQEVLGNPLISQLRSDLNRAESRLQELNTRYGESHPQLIEAKITASELRSRLEVEMRRVSGGAAVSNTINRRRESEVSASLEAQRAKVLRLKAVRDDAAVLTRDVDSKQRAFDGISARLTQSNLESQNDLNNANVLTEAVPPIGPSSPRVVLNTVLAFVVGLVLGLGLALLLELRDRRVRDTEDAVSAMQLPLIGILPAPRSRRSDEKGRLLGMERRLLSHRQLAGGPKGIA
jgi:chain length determinant protein EpsF